MTELPSTPGPVPDPVSGTASGPVPDPVSGAASGPASEIADPRRLGFGFWLAVGWIVLIVALAFLAPVLPMKDPDRNYIGTDRPPYSPSLEHPLGTDRDARDMLARTIYGSRVSLTVGFSAIAMGMLVGGSLGMVAGFFRGWLDRIISFAFLVLLSFPSLVLAILITALLDRSLLTISLTLGILAIAPIGRLARATTLVSAEREYVTAARTIGARPLRILVRELLPNVVIPMAALALLGVAVAIVAEGGLAFLGLSVSDGSTWGKLILAGSGSRTLSSAPWVAFAPIGALFLTVMALNFAGDRLRQFFDVKEISL